MTDPTTTETPAPTTWDPADLRDATGKSYMLRFLPYLPDEAVTTAIGYVPPRRGYGYGRWEEFFRTEDDARTRMAYLIASGAIEDVELHREVPGGGWCTTMLAEWRDVERHPRNWPAGTRVLLNVRPDRRVNWPWILPPDGTLATVAMGPDFDREVTWVSVGPVGEVFVRFDVEHDTNDGLPVRICGADLTPVAVCPGCLWEGLGLDARSPGGSYGRCPHCALPVRFPHEITERERAHYARRRAAMGPR